MASRPRFQGPLPFALVPLALALPLGAQELRVLPGPLEPGRCAEDLVAEVVHATLDVRTGAITQTRLPDTRILAASSAPPPCFDNSDLFCDMGPYEPYTIGNALGDEIVDWGIKACSGTGLVSSITFAYRTSALDTNDGGPGAAIGFALYSGTLGWNTVGSEIFRREFHGLPAQAAPAGATHTAPFVFITLDFSDAPLVLPDGPIGWGYTMLDNVDATYATGALLVTAPNATTGVIDALDVFSPGPATTGTYVGTFNFGTTCNHPPCCPHASTWLQVTEVTADGVVVDGSGVNPQLFSELLPPRIGQAWVTSFDLSAHPTAAATMVYLSMAGAATPIQTPYGELFLDMTLRLGDPSISMDSHLMAIPNDPSLFGMVVYTQGVVRDKRPVLTNGLRLTLTL